MPRSRSVATFALVLAVVAGSAREVAAQDAAPMRALELEQAGKLREAAVAYRQALTDASLIPAVLGLERVYSLLGRGDSLMPLIDSLVEQRPRDPMLRTVQLRTLTALQRDAAARQVFEQWLRYVPRDAAPYRTYARLLLDEGRSAAADTILQRAQHALGRSRDVSAELAQLRAAMGMWEPAARSWREAMYAMPYLEQAAVFSLIQAPAGTRDTIRAVFLAPPAELVPRKIVAALDSRWRSPREGWMALRDLAPSDSVVVAWTEFAEQAEDAGAWLAARDALAAALRARPSEALAARAAGDALEGGDAASALQLLAQAQSGSEASGAATLLPLEIRALSALGRPADAEARLASAGAQVDSAARASMSRSIAWGWVRAGDLVRARAALTRAGEGTDDRIAGLIALYEGDLATARKTLRHTLDASPDLVLAMAFLARTRAEQAPEVGAAFLALARGDSTGAATAFVAAANRVPDAAPLLLAIAARIQTARHDDAHAVPIWRALVEQHASAPEGAEAELEWARALRRAGDTTGATARLEHLILTYPQSALVPQARRELELLRNSVPPQP